MVIESVLEYRCRDNALKKNFGKLFKKSSHSRWIVFNSFSKKCLSSLLCASFFFSPLPIYQTQEAHAAGGTRTLWLHFTHTGEEKKITFRRNGKYDPQGVKEMQWILRDWRRNEATKMDPRLFDLIWSVYQESGATKPIRVVSGFRSKKTNNALRRRSRGVAKNSQHTLGKAMDFFIPGVPVKKLREIGLKMQVGGVGYYPGSRTPFVHMDTGRVRHWPRMTPKQLASVFPDGKTLHVSTAGKKQRRYAQALAEYNARKTRVVEPLSRSKRIRIASNEKTKDKKKSGGLFANLFNGNDKRENGKKQQTAPKVIASSIKSETPKITPAPTKRPGKELDRKAAPTLVANKVEETTPIPSRIGRVEEKSITIAKAPAPRALPNGLRENSTPPQAIIVANIPSPLQRPAFEARLEQENIATPQIVIAKAHIDTPANQAPQIIDPTKKAVIKRSDFNVPTPKALAPALVKNSIEQTLNNVNQPANSNQEKIASEEKNPIQLALKDFQPKENKKDQPITGQALAYASANDPVENLPKLDAKAFNQRFGQIDENSLTLNNGVPEKVIKKLTESERLAALEIDAEKPSFSLEDLGLANKKSQVALRKSLGLDKAPTNKAHAKEFKNNLNNPAQELAFSGESKTLVSALMANSSLSSKTHVKLTVPQPSHTPELFTNPSQVFSGSFKTTQTIDFKNEFKGETINITPTVDFTKTATTKRFSWLSR